MPTEATDLDMIVSTISVRERVCMSYLIATNAWLEIQIRNVHLFETKRAFSVILEIIAMVSLSLNMMTLQKGGSRPHRRSNTRLGRQPKRGTLIARLRNQHARPARAVTNASEVWWPFLQMRRQNVTGCCGLRTRGGQVLCGIYNEAWRCSPIVGCLCCGVIVFSLPFAFSETF
jgi:hypothetical protein